MHWMDKNPIMEVQFRTYHNVGVQLPLPLGHAGLISVGSSWAYWK